MRTSALNIFNVQERPVLLVQSLFSFLLIHSRRLLAAKESLARNVLLFISHIDQSDCRLVRQVLTAQILHYQQVSTNQVNTTPDPSVSCSIEIFEGFVDDSSFDVETFD